MMNLDLGRSHVTGGLFLLKSVMIISQRKRKFTVGEKTKRYDDLAAATFAIYFLVQVKARCNVMSLIDLIGPVLKEK